MNERTNRISEYTLERFLLGELPQEELEAVQRQVEADAELRARLAALERSNQELLEQYPPAWMGRQIRLRAEGPAVAPGRRWRAVRLWAVPVALAALAVVIAPDLFLPDQNADSRIKGLEPHLQLFRKAADESELLADGSTAREGDFVQIKYLAAGEKYGSILSLDGQGAVTQHMPAEGNHAVELGQEGPIPLGFSYELDDAPRWERFFFVTADIPFDIAVARRAVFQAMDSGRADRLDLPPGFTLDVFTLQKDAGP